MLHSIKYKSIASRIGSLAFLLLLWSCSQQVAEVRETFCFNSNWRFSLNSNIKATAPEYNDSNWRVLDLPHDWSIEGGFSPDHPATPGGGALPGGMGWYRKSFQLDSTYKGKNIYIDFDGVYMNSDVWINGQHIGNRPNGYISFRYDLTPHLNFGSNENLIVVRVDNTQQPNSRWYSGSGIYRNVRLVVTNGVHVAHWGTYITTPRVDKAEALVSIQTALTNTLPEGKEVVVTTRIICPLGRSAGRVSTNLMIADTTEQTVSQEIVIPKPKLWSVDSPNLYKAISIVEYDGKVKDTYETTFGIRNFEFSPTRGFILNGEPLKILGVCNHHDLGCLGAAVNRRAIERQLEILKAMGCNGIRTSHNPPAPELLELCDRMGFIVMVEAFDIWAKPKSEFDYHLYWDEWHERDLQDMILRDRNHPSVFMWSVGNEVLEQWHEEEGIAISRRLAGIVRDLDPTRPITAGCNNHRPSNPLFRSGALDIIGFNYEHDHYESVPKKFPGMPFIATETTSAIASRGTYDMPADSVRVWPVQWDVPVPGNPDHTCSSYDNCHVGWGTTHMETWRLVKKHDFISGMFIWTGFDYLGEPTPYSWPARSSYFGIIDLAGFPKDIYYMYQSEWTDEKVLHILPHWTWSKGDTLDVWVYTNAKEVELFLNDKSLGKLSKGDDDLHLAWRSVPFQQGTLRAVASFENGETRTTQVKTAGKPYKVRLEVDRVSINADGQDLAFVTASIVDNEGTLVPNASNMIQFRIDGSARIVGVDNGNQTSHEPFKANHRKAFKGKCLAVVQSNQTKGQALLHASSEGLISSNLTIELK